jgi:hypothetical protein
VYYANHFGFHCQNVVVDCRLAYGSGRLFGLLVGCIAGLFVGLLVGSLVRVAGWLAVPQVCWFTGWFIG